MQKTHVTVGFCVAATFFSISANAVHNIIGGMEISPQAWPAHLIVESGAEYCSATLVGPRAVLTAAHCVRESGTVHVTLSGTRHELVCYSHPSYPLMDYDVAVCLFPEPVTEIVAENIDISSELESGTEAFIAGWGCNQPGGGGFERKLRAGIALLMEKANEQVTLLGKAAACFGDSGGAAMLPLHYASGSRVPTTRSVFGVISKGNIRDRTYVTVLSDPSVTKFLNRLARTEGLKFCGLHDIPGACRKEQSSELQPPQSCVQLTRGSPNTLSIFNSCLTGATTPKLEICEDAREAVEQCYNDRHQMF